MYSQVSLRKTLQNVKPLLPSCAADSIVSSASSSTRDPLFIFVNKGIESETNALTIEIVADTLGKKVARIATFVVRYSRYYLEIPVKAQEYSRARLSLRKVRTAAPITRLLYR